MARRRQAPPIATWTPHEWVPFDDAFIPIMASAGSPALAAHDLYQDLRSRRLSSALRQMLPDGKDEVRFLSPSDWEQWTLRWQNAHTPFGLATIVLIVIGKDGKTVDGHFFVRRAGLEKHYGTANPTAAAQAPTAADDDSPPPPPRLTPGPKPKDDWPKELAAELIRIAVLDSTALRNVDELARNIQIDFANTGRFLPQDPKRVRHEILLLLKRIR